MHRIERVVALPKAITGVNGKLMLWPVCKEATAGAGCVERVCDAIRSDEAAQISRATSRAAGEAGEWVNGRRVSG